MPPVTVIATLKTIHGKPNDPGAAPVADLALRTEATPDLLTLFGGIGQEFDVTFVRRGVDQMTFDDMLTTTDDDDDADIDVTAAELEEITRDVEVPFNNGATHEPAPVPTGGRRRR